MSPRAWMDRVHDILEAIAEIKEFTRSMSLDQFRNDVKTLKAVALDIVIIGEAAGRVPEDVATAHPEIAWNLMRGMRNRLVHDYFGIDADIVWDTIQDDLPSVVEPLERLLQDR
jgi:uncharacterized protein with HEPN domain